MTPEQLAEIRARAEAATPGPWGEYERDGKHRALYVGSPLGADFEFLAMARTDIPALLDYIEELEWQLDTTPYALALRQAKANLARLEGKEPSNA